MRKRRNFIKATLFVASGAMLGNSAFAGDKKGKIFPGVIYTAENPGKWAEKVSGHAPEVSVDGKQVSIKTDHIMSSKHYIVRHTLVAEKGEVIGEKTFYPENEEAVSTFTLPENCSGKLYATSFCNKHDLWLTELDV